MICAGNDVDIIIAMILTCINDILETSNIHNLELRNRSKYQNGEKVKAEKERARKALELEARREQGAVSETHDDNNEDDNNEDSDDNN